MVELAVESDGIDIFVVADGIRIAKRGHRVRCVLCRQGVGSAAI
jgi:hypothetical protein